jgi:hypothetical protein
MPRGGSRNRSGPPPAEDSGRSDARGVVFTALPSEGCKRKPPAWPLSRALNEAIAVLEDARWVQVWKSPQAVAWHVQPWRWLTVAHYVRIAVGVELGGKAADVTAMIRLADQIGMTPAGLKENGWKIAEDQVAAKRTAKKATARPSARSRMTVVRGNGGA